MRKVMLLVTALATVAIVPAAASAQGYPAGSHVTSSFGIKIVVRDAPKVVEHHHHPVRHLRPQPWPRHFAPHPPHRRFGHHAPHRRFGHHAPHRRWGHHAPPRRWHNPSRPAPRHFHGHHGGHRGWVRGPDRPSFRDGDHGRRAHAPHRSSRGGRHGPPQRSGSRHGR